MEHRQYYNDAPQVAEPNLPEVTRDHRDAYKQDHSPGQAYAVPEQSHYGTSAWGDHSNASYAQHNEEEKREEQRTTCGVPTVMFILCCVIGLLSIAVVGLAAATGVEANRATSVAAQLAAATSAAAAKAPATVTVAEAVPTAWPADPNTAQREWDVLTNGCSLSATTVSGTTYQTIDLLGPLNFTMQCNSDANGDNLLSLFVADFNGCMDACASWTRTGSQFFGKTVNATCGAVSYIPLWTTRTNATLGGAPGNCYLKTTKVQLKSPNIGTECHAAVLQQSHSSKS